MNGVDPLGRVNLGNANAFQATQISTLNNIPANSNLQFTADDRAFHLYEPTNLLNTYLYDTFEYADVTQSNFNSAVSSSVVFQFNNPNWVNTRDMYLEWPVELSVETPYTHVTGGAWEMDPMLVNNPIACLGIAGSNSLESVPLFSLPPEVPADNAIFAASDRFQPTTTFDNGMYPNEAVLQLFSQIEVYGGTNNQPLGRTSMFQAPNIPAVAQVDKMGPDTARIWGYSGLPQSSTRFSPLVGLRQVDGVYTAATATVDCNILCTGNMSNKGSRVSQEALQSFEKVIRMASPVNGALRNLPPPTSGNGYRTYTNKFVVSIPLAKISEWFKTDKMVPPEFRYKITINFYNNAINAYIGTVLDRSLSAPNALKIDMHPVIFKLRSNANPQLGGQTPQIKYKSYVCTPTLQQALNLKWAQNPFTYNEETSEPYIMQGYPYSEVISTSQQRPLALQIVVTAINSKPIDRTMSNVNIAYIANQTVPWLDQNYNPILISEIEVQISGKNAIRYTNFSTDQNEIIPTGFENIFNNLNQKCAQNYSSQPGANQLNQCGTFTSNNGGWAINLPISAGMYWDNGIYPTDQGAIQLKLIIKTSAKLHTDFQITVYKLLTTQISVDTNLKTSLTEWPARVIQAQAGNSSALVQPNVVQGN